MAESFAIGLADKLLGKLASTSLQEVTLACGVNGEAEGLKGTMSTIQAVLLDAEEMQAKDHRLSIWLRKLKDVFADAEDVVDELEYEALEQKARGIREEVRSFFSSSNPLAFRLKMVHKMKKIRERLDKLAADKSQFNLAERLGDTPAFHREREMTHSFVRASDVIGRENDKKYVVELLMQSSDAENVSVIPIVGIGGLGKTTLAKLVYNDGRVVDHFHKKMWVCVSNDFDIKRLIKEILTSATNEKCDHLSIDQLQSRLRNALEDNRFFLILDDVWNTDRDKWLELKALIRGGVNGSKILVTTRSKLVASIMGTSPAYELKGLSPEECLSLLIKCAFDDGQDKQYPNLIKIGEGIVRKCGGTPLAVRTLGGILYSKKAEYDWVRVQDNEIWKLEQREDDILPALKLSYDELSFHLKQCFVFCSLFPKDYKFKHYELIQMWIAQGLIPPSEQNEEMEDTGNRYINELLLRSFFQDVEEEIPKFLYNFKMHDLVHDLALSVARPECIMLSFHSENISEKTQHISVLDTQWPKEEEVLRFLRKLSNVRTISFPIINAGPTTESFVATCTSRFKYMRVLDLHNSGFEALPNSIRNLKHLRYLDLSDNKRIKKLPNFICKLHHLQMLLLGGCVSLEELPRDIGKMTSLRHLTVTTQQMTLPHKKVEAGKGCFNSLRLLCIAECHCLESVMEETRSLTALRTLVIEKCPRLLSLPKHLPALENLIISNCESLDLRIWNGEKEDHTQGFGNLRLLVIWILPKLETLPRWLLRGPASNTLHHLQILGCQNFRALSEEEEPLNLTSLETLTIVNCPQFSSLLEGVNHHFTALRQLDIMHCPELSVLPEEMHNLPALSQLRIEGCPELVERCQPGMGEDWNKIAHIVDIFLDGEKIESTIHNEVTKGGLAEDSWRAFGKSGKLEE